MKVKDVTLASATAWEEDERERTDYIERLESIKGS